MSETEIVVTEEFRRLHAMRAVRHDADRFLRAFKLLQEDNKKNLTTPQSSGHADMVNLTFAIELFLKSLLYSEGIIKPPARLTIHNLQKLFEKLPSSVQAEIKSELNNWLSTRLWFQSRFEYLLFDEMLKSHANSYHNLRYLFETGSYNFNYQFCENFAYVLAEIAEKYEKRLLSIAIKQHQSGEIKGIPLE